MPVLQEVAADECHVIEDAQAEGDEGHQVEIEAEPIADEGEQDGDDRVDQEPADEDPIVVDAVELGPDGPEHRIERGEDRHGRVATELETDVDVEDETQKDAHQESQQRKQQRWCSSSLRWFRQGYPTGRRTANSGRPSWCLARL